MACCATRATPSRRWSRARPASIGPSASPFDAIVLDIWLPGMDGLATLAKLQERHVDAPVIMISGHGNIESAVRAIKMGAFDFIEKPLSLDKTVLVVGERGAAAAARGRRTASCARRLTAATTIVGDSYVMQQLLEQVAMAAPTNGRVLISRRERHRQGAGRAHDPRQQPPRTRAVHRGQLRGDSRGADRERAVRPHEGRVHRRGRPIGAASSSWPTAARCSSTRSAT